jgi:hypothetical protein
MLRRGLYAPKSHFADEDGTNIEADGITNVLAEQDIHLQAATNHRAWRTGMKELDRFKAIREKYDSAEEAMMAGGDLCWTKKERIQATLCLMRAPGAKFRKASQGS